MIKNGTARGGASATSSPRSRRRLTIMECPSGESNLEHIKPILPLSWSPILILPLHSHEVESQSEDPDNHADGTAPPDNRRTDQIILDLVVCPSTHSQSEVEEGPIGWRRGENVFLVRVGHQSIVRSHHGNVKMPEILPEGGLVEFDIALRH